MTAKTTSNSLGCTLALFVLLSIIPFTILNGMIGAKLWEWFMVDQFGLVSISAVQAMGIGLVARFFTYITPEGIAKEYKVSSTSRLIASYTTPFGFLGLGWLYLQFI